jgi:hypothetical protein
MLMDKYMITNGKAEYKIEAFRFVLKPGGSRNIKLASCLFDML